MNKSAYDLNKSEPVIVCLGVGNVLLLGLNRTCSMGIYELSFILDINDPLSN